MQEIQGPSICFLLDVYESDVRGFRLFIFIFIIKRNLMLIRWH